MKELVKKLADEYAQLQLDHYKYLHAHPELSFEEFETAEYIKKHLTELGVPFEVGKTNPTSVIGVIEGNLPGPTIAIRADIDALPVNEEVDVPYKSTVPNVMHACGHDSHCATLLTFAKMMTEHKELVKGKIKLLFQCAEEKIPGGAKGICEDGFIDDVDQVFGFHNGATMEMGNVVSNIGANSACIAIYEVTVHGQGGHGSSPHKALNPVPVACQLATLINQILPEKSDPTAAAVLTVSYIKNKGGNYPNIIDNDVVLGGNLRTFDNDLTAKVLEQIRKLAEGLCEINGMTCDVTTTVGYPATVNTEKETLIVRSAVEELGLKVVVKEPGLGGEDFAYYLLKKPGSFCSVGMCAPEDVETAAPHHNGKYKLNLNGLRLGLEVETAIYLKAVENC